MQLNLLVGWQHHDKNNLGGQ